MKLDELTIFAVAMITFWLVAVVGGYGTPNGWIMQADGRPVQADFVGVYAAGQVTRAEDATAAYDWEKHKAAHREITGDADPNYYPWPYPPSFLFVALALSALPYYSAMFIFAAGTFVAFAAALTQICANQRHLLLMLAAPAAWLNLYVGQNGALTAALIGFGLVFLPARPVLAGVLFGLLSFKPHLGLLLPIALAAGGHWRAFITAGVTVVILAAITTLVFGPAAWGAMVEQMMRISEIVKTTDTTGKIQSVFGFVRGIGLPAEVASVVHGATLLGLVAGIAWLWRQRDVGYGLKAAALATAMTLASPYQFVYDLVILTIAQAFLLRHIALDAKDRPIDAFEICVLKVANLAVFLFGATDIPLGVVASGMVLALIARRVLAERPVTAPIVASPQLG